MRGRSAVVYLAYLQDELVGFFTLSNSSVLAQDAPSRIRVGQPGVIPLVLIGRLAVDLRFQGQGIGLELLSWAVIMCLEVAERSGVVAIRVDAADEVAAKFWRSVAGFEPSPTNPRALFWPLKQAAKAVSGSLL